MQWQGGYQGEHGDVKALAMKKWFNTNYHYIVPETEDDTKIKLSGDKLWNEYAEADEFGIETKPMLTGAYTMLKLCRYTGNKSEKDYVCDIIAAYKELLQTCGKKQIAWVQLTSRHLYLIWMIVTRHYSIRFMMNCLLLKQIRKFYCKLILGIFVIFMRKS